MNEKRSHDRLTIVGEVILKDESDNSVIAEGFLDNISYSGALIFLRREIKQGITVLAEFKMSFLTDHIIIKSSIKHVKQSLQYKYPIFMVGMKFSEADKGKAEYIIKRIHSVFSEKQRKNTGIKPPDFIPY